MDYEKDIEKHYSNYNELVLITATGKLVDGSVRGQSAPGQAQDGPNVQDEQER